MSDAYWTQSDVPAPSSILDQILHHTCLGQGRYSYSYSTRCSPLCFCHKIAPGVFWKGKGNRWISKYALYVPQVSLWVSTVKFTLRQQKKIKMLTQITTTHGPGVARAPSWLLYTTQYCPTTTCVITAVSYCQHWVYLPPQREWLN